MGNAISHRYFLGYISNHLSHDRIILESKLLTIWGSCFARRQQLNLSLFRTKLWYLGCVPTCIYTSVTYATSSIDPTVDLALLTVFGLSALQLYRRSEIDNRCRMQMSSYQDIEYQIIPIYQRLNRGEHPNDDVVKLQNNFMITSDWDVGVYPFYFLPYKTRLNTIRTTFDRIAEKYTHGVYSPTDPFEILYKTPIPLSRQI